MEGLLKQALHALRAGRSWEALGLYWRAFEGSEGQIPSLAVSVAIAAGEVLGGDDTLDVLRAGDDPRAKLLADVRAKLQLGSPDAQVRKATAMVTDAPGRGLRVLIVDQALPQPDRDAGSVRMQAIARLFVMLGCRVTFVGRKVNFGFGYAQTLRELGIEVVCQPEMLSVHELLARRGGDFDLVWVCRHLIAARLVAAVRRCAPQALVIFDTVDLHYLRESREAAVTGGADDLRRAALTRTHELAMVGAADVTIVVSEAERAVLAEDAPDADVRVLSIVHDRENVEVLFGERQDAIFIGNFEHRPNVDAMRWYIENVWPLVRARLPALRTFVVGTRGKERLADVAAAGIEIVGFVEDLAPLLARCRVGIAPLRFGAGVKGKIGTMLAAGVPVVATPVATEGMHLGHGRDVLVAESAAEFAEAVVHLHQDEALWSRIMEGAARTLDEHFSSAVASHRIATLLADCRSRREPAQSAPARAALPASRAPHGGRRDDPLRCLVLVPSSVGAPVSDANVRGLLQGLREHRPEALVDLVSFAVAGPAWPRLPGAANALRISPGAYPPGEWPRRWRGMLERYAAFCAVGRDADDAMHSADDFRSAWPFALGAARAGVATAIFGADGGGASPDDTIDDMREVVLHGCVFARDEAVRQRLSGMGCAGVRVTSAFAVLMAPAADAGGGAEIERWMARERASGRCVVIFGLSGAAVREAARTGDKPLVADCAPMIGELVNRHAVSALVIAHDLRAAISGSPSDVALALELSERIRGTAGLQHSALFVASNAPEVKRVAGGADLVVASEQALMTAALGMGVPTTAIASGDASRELFGHFGMPTPIDTNRFDARRLSGQCLRMLGERDVLRRQIEAALPAIVARARLDIARWLDTARSRPG